MTKLHYHDSVMGLLESLAKLDPMVGPVELCCCWFDDFYFPAHKDKEGFNPGVWERGQKEWRECFSEKELKVLATFHEVFDSVVENVSEDQLTFAQDANWLKVSAAAKAALTELQK